MPIRTDSPHQPAAAAAVPIAMVRAALGALVGGDGIPLRTDDSGAVIIDERFCFAATTVQRMARTGLGLRTQVSVESAPGWRVAQLLPGPVMGYRESRDLLREHDLCVCDNADQALRVLIGALATMTPA